MSALRRKDIQPTTRREVLVAREAYIQGAADRARLHAFGHAHEIRTGLNVSPFHCDGATLRPVMPAGELAAILYPLPRITRPRVVTDPEPGYDQSWSVVDGVLCYQGFAERKPLTSPENKAHPGNCLWPTPKRIALWADLLANPLEEIDDTGAEP